MEEERNIAKKRNARTGLPDANALYLQWLESEDSIGEFASKFGDKRSMVENMAWNQGWSKRRKEIITKATSKIEKKYEAEIVEDWKEQREIWKKIEGKALELLENVGHGSWCKKGCDKIHAPTAKDLVSIASAVDKALSARRLIAGKDKSEGEQVVNHSLVVQILQILKDKIQPIDTTAENGRDTPSL